jgi:hypothetical protein
MSAFLSCKKDKDEKVAVDLLSFGTAYGYCIGDCAFFFRLEGENIYPDSSTRYTGEGSIVFSSNPLSNDKYLLAKELKDNFPVYLLNNDGKTFGCPDCTDQGGFHIEVKENSISKFWHIDTDSNKQPAEIRSYMERMRVILSQL